MEKNNIAPVEIEPHNSEWAEKFERAKAELQGVMDKVGGTLEHMGSTSVPGLMAKPEIDILGGLNTLEDIEPHINELREIGYPYYKRFEENTPQRRYFRKSEGIKPLVHVHMYKKDSDDYKKHILFRDHLRAHLEVAKQYEDLKKKLLEVSAGDRGIYQDGKKEFIEEVIKGLN